MPRRPRSIQLRKILDKEAPERVELLFRGWTQIAPTIMCVEHSFLNRAPIKVTARAGWYRAHSSSATAFVSLVGSPIGSTCVGESGRAVRHYPLALGRADCGAQICLARQA